MAGGTWQRGCYASSGMRQFFRVNTLALLNSDQQNTCLYTRDPLTCSIAPRNVLLLLYIYGNLSNGTRIAFFFNHTRYFFQKLNETSVLSRPPRLDAKLPTESAKHQNDALTECSKVSCANRRTCYCKILANPYSGIRSQVNSGDLLKQLCQAHVYAAHPA